MKYDFSNQSSIEIKTIVLDLNGTLAVNGQLVVGVAERIERLKNELGFRLILLSGDQRGNGSFIANALGIDFRKANSREEKECAILEYDCKTTAAIGNARIDIGTFKQAKIAIATLQGEGIHTGILKEVDIIVPSILDALDLFIDPDSFKATMKI